MPADPGTERTVKVILFVVVLGALGVIGGIVGGELV